jgi:rhodanese-related sulfurtransferase
MAAPNPRFHQLVNDAKTRIREISAADAVARQKAGAVLVDVREASDYAKEHAVDALGLSKGIVELRIEETVPDTAKEIIFYCGGGSRSALVADNLQKMGYTNVLSMTGGFKAWKDQGLPTTT